jgi:hypothetical protein
MQADLVLTEIDATKIVAGAFPKDAARANDLTHVFNNTISIQSPCA